MRFVAILPDAYAFPVTYREIAHCTHQTLLGSRVKPTQSLFIIPIHTLPRHVERANVILRFGKPLFRRPEKPNGGFLVILRGTEAARVANTEFKLRAGDALFRHQAKPPYGFGIVLPGAFAFRVTAAKKKLRVVVALLCCFAITLKIFRLLKLSQHAVAIAELVG